MVNEEFEDVNLLMERAHQDYQQILSDLIEDMTVLKNPEVLGFASKLFRSIRIEYLEAISSDFKNYNILVTLEKRHEEIINLLSEKKGITSQEDSNNIDDGFFK